MIVVQINSECGRGSTGKIACSISKLLSEKGIENYIFYSGNHKSDFPNGIQINSKFSIRWHQILSRIFGDQGFHSGISTLRLVRQIKKLQPDAILLHNLHGYYLHIGILFRFLKKYDRPVYWTLHDCWAFTGHCTHFTHEQCDQWKENCGKCPCKNKYPYSLLFDRSRILLQRKKQLYGDLRQLHIITPSVWLAKMVRCSFLKDNPITVIPNGINLEVFQYTENTFKKDHHIEEKKMILGVASVWNDRKGLDILQKLADRNPQWKVVLVGTDIQKDKQLSKCILSIHRTNNQRELAEIYSAADVFVNPTKEDNYPTVNIEAIACGTPVVTFDTGGASEMVLTRCGLVCRENSVEEMEHCISQILTAPNDFSCKAERYKFDEKSCFYSYVELITGGENSLA